MRTVAWHGVASRHTPSSWLPLVPARAVESSHSVARSCGLFCAFGEIGHEALAAFRSHQGATADRAVATHALRVVRLPRLAT